MTTGGRISTLPGRCPRSAPRCPRRQPVGRKAPSGTPDGPHRPPLRWHRDRGHRHARGPTPAARERAPGPAEATAGPQPGPAAAGQPGRRAAVHPRPRGSRDQQRSRAGAATPQGATEDLRQLPQRGGSPEPRGTADHAGHGPETGTEPSGDPADPARRTGRAARHATADPGRLSHLPGGKPPE